MLPSFRNTLTDIHRNNVLPALWASLVQASYHIKLTIIGDKKKKKEQLGRKTGT
jgi:hypothetical protein